MKLTKILRQLLKEFEGDSNPLKLKYIDTWHDGQYKADDGKTEEAIKLMTQAANEAEKIAREKQDGNIAGEANYYKGTIAWLKKDYNTVEKYINDKFVKITGNDEVLKRLLNNKDKPYKEAYPSSSNINEDESSNMNTQYIKQIIKEELEKILFELDRFSSRPQKPQKGSNRRFFSPPKFFVFPGSVREKLKDYFKFYGGIMYVDPQVLIALGYITQGKQSYDKTQYFPSLTKTLQDKLPQPVRLSIKKGAEGQKMQDIGDKKMVPLNLDITKDGDGNYLIKNPYTNINEYKTSLLEVLLLEKKNVSNIYQLESLLVTDTSVRNQAEILSDIRSLPGITIVSTDPLNPDQNVQNKDRVESKLYLKIDPHPFLGKGGFGEKELETVYSSIKKIKGVTVFRVIGKPNRKTLR